MPTYVHTGDGQRTNFKCPSISNYKHPRVNGVPVHFTDASTESITLDVAPAHGAIVEVIADPAEGVDVKSIPFTLGADCIPPVTPVIRFHGKDSNLVQFTVDPLAKRMDIWEHQIDTSY